MSKTPKFEILCVTMNQKDFSKVEDMNIHSNVLFANQADTTAFESKDFDGFTARMITTNTRGVGINRNLALSYANAEFCLFADDDVTYVDDLEQIVVNEFEKHTDADIFIFHLETEDKQRKQVKYSKTHKCGHFARMPWGGCRIAVRLSSIKKANVWFTTLFGGGTVFPSGEDSMWLTDAKNKGLTFYVSDKTIGKVAMDDSSWFSGYNEKFYFAKGAFYSAVHPKTILLWKLYFAFRTRNMTKMPLSDKMKWMKIGQKGYKNMMAYEKFIK